MNAQEKWKAAYKKYRAALSDFCETDELIDTMYSIRREAALERKLAAAEREIDALKSAADKFSRQHYYGAECNPQVDPQDWYEFDAAFGIEQAQYRDDGKP
jgi:hypothetical protein